MLFFLKSSPAISICQNSNSMERAFFLIYTATSSIYTTILFIYIIDAAYGMISFKETTEFVVKGTLKCIF